MSGCQLLWQRKSASRAAGASAWMKNLGLESEMVMSTSAAVGNLNSRHRSGAELPQCDMTWFIKILKFPGQEGGS